MHDRASSIRRWVAIAGLVAALVVPAVVVPLGGASADSTGSAAAALEAVVPARVLETRVGKPTADGESAGIGRLGAGSTTAVRIAGRLDVPANASAVVLNVTVVNPSARGNVVVFPCGEDRPVASNLNYLAGDVVANAVFAQVGTSGSICVYTTTATDMVIDLNGWFPAGGALQPMTPARALETRSGKPTADGGFQGIGQRQAGSETAVQVAGRLDIPANAAAVVLNVTVVNPTARGNAVVYPCGSDRPVASNLNYLAGDVVPNAVVARVGEGGQVCLHTTSPADYVIDVNGWFPAESSLNAVAPARVLETRSGKPTADGESQGIGRLAPGAVTEVRVAGRLEVPIDAAAVVLNVTAVNASTRGNAVVFPCGDDRPVASTLNYVGGDVVANAAVARVGDGGAVCVVSTAAADMVIDLNGWFAADAAGPVGPGGGSTGGTTTGGSTGGTTTGGSTGGTTTGGSTGGTTTGGSTGGTTTGGSTSGGSTGGTSGGGTGGSGAGGSPTFSPPRTIGTEINAVHAVAVDDFNGDGLADAAGANYGAGGVEVLFQQPNGTFVKQFLSPWVWGPYPITSGDLDSDGDADILVAMYGQGAIAWWRNDGGGTLTYVLIDDAVEGAHSIEAIDLDFDGDMDLVVTNQGAHLAQDVAVPGHNTGSIEVYYNDGNENFTRQRVGMGVAAKDAFAGDFDGDGDLDIVSARYGDATVAWHERQGGSWTEHVIDAGAPGAYNVDVGDFDRDGRLDIAAATLYNNEVAVYRNVGGNNPKAMFSKQVIDGQRTAARSVTVRDVDQDGRLDIVAASRDDNTVAFYRNTGNNAAGATFERQILSSDITGAYGVTVADIDGDGDFDVVSAAVRGTIDVFENVTP